MQQIADWLGTLGMSGYVGRFAENKIDIDVLRHLTDEDLKEIGIPLGHRCQIAPNSDPQSRMQERPF
jgi:hypothetical protein